MTSAIAEKKMSSRLALKAGLYDGSVDVAIMFARDDLQLLHLSMRKRAGGSK
jgi:hypothetical protein